jgi:hypothetical protein
MGPGAKQSSEGASMTTLNEGSTPAELTDQRDAAADVQGRNIQGPSVQGPKVQGPMSQQAAFGSQGYDIYPQTLVRLVGCHQSNALAARPLRTAA